MTDMRMCIHNFFCKANCILAKLTSPVNLLVRLYIANIFFKSGLVKFMDWSGTVYLFQYEYKVPVLSYALAAFLATAVELVGSVFLAFGLATRFSALALLFLTAVINYTYQSTAENYYWMLILAMLTTQGGKLISLDFLLKRRFCDSHCTCACCNKTCSHGMYGMSCCAPTHVKNSTEHHSSKKRSVKRKK